MKCEDALLLISGHMDQENTPEEEAQLLEHLQQCSECRNVLRAFTELDGGLVALEEEPPSGLRENVMAAIRAESAVSKKKNRRWAGLAVAAAMAIVIGVGVAAMPQLHHDPADAPMAVRSVPMAAEEVSVYSADALSVETSPQDIAEARQAAVAVTYELLPEMEVCTCETLESGALLYCLENAESAELLSLQYDLELFQPEKAADDVSYALLLPAE